MKVFISWSGSPSKEYAAILSWWLKCVLQTVETSFSPDMEKGASWFDYVMTEIRSSDFGVLCVTPSNTDSPWLLFEAGALASKVDRPRVCPLLFDIADAADVAPPLSLVQGAVFSREEIRRLVQDLNGFGPTRLLTDRVMDETFEVWWPRLETAVSDVSAKLPKQKRRLRSERKVLDEVLSYVRMIDNRTRQPQRLIDGLLGLTAPEGPGTTMVHPVLQVLRDESRRVELMKIIMAMNAGPPMEAMRDGD